jgi:hypothetical protein
MSAHTPVRVRDTVRVNPIWVVVLNSGLSRGKASEGREAEGECGTHVEDVMRFEDKLRENCWR